MDATKSDAEEPSQPTVAHGRRLSRLLACAGAIGLVGLGLTVLPMAGITPIRLALSFGVGQPLCGLALLLYAFAVLTDLRRKKVL
ncbi:MAG: hypothetical protein AAB434_06440 [Planctomycetota bacterium]